MKVFLLKDVVNVGQRGDIINVKDGFGRNFLIRRGLARIADAEMEKIAESKITQQKKAEKTRTANLREYKEKLQQITLTITQKANEKGRLFAALGAEDIASLLRADGFRQISQDHILGCPLKTVGEHSLDIRIGTDVVHIGVIIKAL